MEPAGSSLLDVVIPKTQRVAVIGASDNPERYSNRAIQQLLAYGHFVFPVTPKRVVLPGLMVYPSILQVPQPVETVTIYVNPRILESLVGDIVDSKPGRVIFNPGSEHLAAAKAFRDAGIQTENSCTLVLLTSGQF